jgi:hypothetical protein
MILSTESRAWTWSTAEAAMIDDGGVGGGVSSDSHNALLLAQANSIAGVLPWAYVSSDLKKNGSRLLDTTGTKIQLFDFDANYSSNYVNGLSSNEQTKLLNDLKEKYLNELSSEDKASFEAALDVLYPNLSGSLLKELVAYDLSQHYSTQASDTHG